MGQSEFESIERECEDKFESLSLEQDGKGMNHWVLNEIRESLDQLVRVFN